MCGWLRGYFVCRCRYSSATLKLYVEGVLFSVNLLYSLYRSLADNIDQAGLRGSVADYVRSLLARVSARFSEFDIGLKIAKDISSPALRVYTLAYISGFDKGIFNGVYDIVLDEARKLDVDSRLFVLAGLLEACCRLGVGREKLIKESYGLVGSSGWEGILRFSLGLARCDRVEDALDLVLNNVKGVERLAFSLAELSRVVEEPRRDFLDMAYGYIGKVYDMGKRLMFLSRLLWLERKVDAGMVAVRVEGLLEGLEKLPPLESEYISLFVLKNVYESGFGRLAFNKVEGVLDLAGAEYYPWDMVELMGHVAYYYRGLKYVIESSRFLDLGVRFVLLASVVDVASERFSKLNFIG